MKKKFNIFITVFLSTVTICLVCLFVHLAKSDTEVFNFINSDFTISNDKLNTITEKELSLENINNIYFDLNVDNITFIDNTDNNLKIVEKSNKELSEKEQIKASQVNDTIKISRNSNQSINSISKSFKRELIVYLPKSYNKNLNINLSLGDISLNSDLNLDKLEIYLTTGDVDINKNLNCKTFILEGNTGDFYINYLYCDNYGISLTNGDVDVSNLFGNGYINTTTGNINCHVYDITGDTDFASSTGDITINIKKQLEFFINVSCDIGKISNDFKSNSFGDNPLYTLNIDCGLGNVKINKNY